MKVSEGRVTETCASGARWRRCWSCLLLPGLVSLGAVGGLSDTHRLVISIGVSGLTGGERTEASLAWP